MSSWTLADKPASNGPNSTGHSYQVDDQQFCRTEITRSAIEKGELGSDIVK
jgi:hypothetical protein